ncbi:PAS domain-containing protein [Pararhizobium sp.]|uniref:PAS domain-containing protein n=1 Tax=Pararhizobium sp. TaxID=1977563 RepID=UPI002717C4DE|nr:PAS domain-containing protein [Pararhizobium sp.]MDO9418670.1 PAS domain-containing protein [Pararhizobium sp.]
MKKLIELFWFKHAQLQQAVRSGDEVLVGTLDRELQAALNDVYQYEILDSAGMRLQFQLFLELLQEEADDASCVLRQSRLLQGLVDRYFGELESNSSGKHLSLLSRSKVLPGEDIGDDVLNEEVLESLPGRVAVITTDYRYLYSNISNAEHLKVRPMQLIGRHISDFVGLNRFHDNVKPNLDRCFAGEVVDYSMKRERSGRTVVTNCRMTPCYATSGRIVGAILVLQEIADRRRSIAA